MKTETQIATIKSKKWGLLTWKENVAGYLFVTPMLLGLTFFTLIPLVASLILSFTEWNFVTGFKSITFLGMDNFDQLINDVNLKKALINNFIFMLVVPATMAFALVLAVIIDRAVYMKSFFKLIYFMPYISSIVAVSIVWQVLFHPSYGPVNEFLMSIGIEQPPKWLADITFALPSVMMIMIWSNIGYNLIIYIAGLQSIPKDLYEAAEIDGASIMQKFWKVTIPMISPTTFFLFITGIIGSFKVFEIVAVLTQGGPAGATNVVVYYLYELAFIHLKMGYASAVSWVLFVIIFIITFLQWWGQKKWVNY